MDCFLFSNLDEAQKNGVLTVFGTPAKFGKGSDLYRVGFIGILLSGLATVGRTSDSGDAVTVRVMHEGEVFGVAGLFGDWKQGKSQVIAKTECTVLYASEEQLKTVFERFPQVAVNYISFLSDRIRFLNRRVDAFSAGSTVQKLYEYLVSQSKDGVIALDFGLAELSRRLKMGRTSLYRSIETLEQSGVLERNGHTFILR